jgi:N-acetylglucosaminyldiphosphoundecaprenol N-acetyl-beta-D-mannosaminyltransferase
LYGREIFTGDPDALLARIGQLVEDGGTHLVMTLNVNQVLDLQKSAPYRSAHQAAALCTLDGMPLVALSRLLGADKPHRNTGADLIFQATSAAPANGWRVALAGGKPTTAARAAQRLSKRYPGAVVDGFELPRLRSIDDQSCAATVERLNALAPSITFICLGAPKQELWFQQWRDRLPPGVYIGAGAAVDFAAGRVKRAPRWVQNTGLEWLWRFTREPRRLFKRYFIQGPNFLAVALASLRRARSPRASTRL